MILVHEVNPAFIQQLQIKQGDVIVVTATVSAWKGSTGWQVDLELEEIICVGKSFMYGNVWYYPQIPGSDTMHFEWSSQPDIQSLLLSASPESSPSKTMVNLSTPMLSSNLASSQGSSSASTFSSDPFIEVVVPDDDRMDTEEELIPMGKGKSPIKKTKVSNCK
ncbi:hypothetical protein BS47DRAFT_1361319 [Hydnum rufescens UP504]|uniref:Uncharacterized protein n=1 Tax=Hydnum rufescens UP504 TaxID=1448309 RepID=A0A9P6B076_9AGAM|nr:hypothetical protein BS47DRAFT_1361319 [Hydnum rufescens UP504]